MPKTVPQAVSLTLAPYHRRRLLGVRDDKVKSKSGQNREQAKAHPLRDDVQGHKDQHRYAKHHPTIAVQSAGINCE